MIASFRSGGPGAQVLADEDAGVAVAMG